MGTNTLSSRWMGSLLLCTFAPLREPSRPRRVFLPGDDGMTLEQKKKALGLRADILREIRTFFEQRDYLEVDTPVRVRTPALEEHIDAEPSGTHWLRTSPELHLKRLVCAGYERVFQIGPCFRQGERGRRHLPEYTMLEWYRAGADSADLIPETLELLRAVASRVGRPEAAGLDREPVVLSVSEVFRELAGWDPVAEFDADRFDLDLVEKVEPWIADQNAPVVLKDFPSARAALAQMRADDPRTADRWELYLGGMELANAYSELTDPVEQRHRFEACAQERRQQGREAYPLDKPFLRALEQGMPDCAGIALGIDRLVMTLGGFHDIADVVAFPEEGGSLSSD